jgi:Contractile injection system tube protein
MTSFEKAKLTFLADGKATPQEMSTYDITFMYNPTEISLSRSMSIEQAKAARDSSGTNKSSFKHPNPYSLKISNIILDTYEAGTSVLPEVEKFKRGVEFLQPQISIPQPSQSGKKNSNQTNPEPQDRPPIYLFTWGKHKYLQCFMKQVTFKFTMFFPNGDPARAVLDLSLEQVSIPKDKNNKGTPQPPKSQRGDPNSPPLDRAIFT